MLRDATIAHTVTCDPRKPTDDRIAPYHSCYSRESLVTTGIVHTPRTVLWSMSSNVWHRLGMIPPHLGVRSHTFRIIVGVVSELSCFHVGLSCFPRTDLSYRTLVLVEDIFISSDDKRKVVLGVRPGQPTHPVCIVTYASPVEHFAGTNKNTRMKVVHGQALPIAGKLLVPVSVCQFYLIIIQGCTPRGSESIYSGHPSIDGGICVRRYVAAGFAVHCPCIDVIHLYERAIDGEITRVS